MIIVFCAECETFFYDAFDNKKCVVCKQTQLIPLNSMEFLAEAEHRCPITYKTVSEADPEVYVYHPKDLLFTLSRFNKEIILPELEGKVLEKEKELFKYLTSSQFKELKKKHEKTMYKINFDGSYQEA